MPRLGSAPDWAEWGRWRENRSFPFDLSRAFGRPTDRPRARRASRAAVRRSRPNSNSSSAKLASTPATIRPVALEVSMPSRSERSTMLRSPEISRVRAKCTSCPVPTWREAPRVGAIHQAASDVSRIIRRWIISVPYTRTSQRRLPQPDVGNIAPPASDAVPRMAHTHIPDIRVVSWVCAIGPVRPRHRLAWAPGKWAKVGMSGTCAQPYPSHRKPGRQQRPGHDPRHLVSGVHRGSFHGGRSTGRAALTNRSAGPAIRDTFSETSPLGSSSGANPGSAALGLWRRLSGNSQRKFRELPFVPLPVERRGGTIGPRKGNRSKRRLEESDGRMVRGSAR